MIKVTNLVKQYAATTAVDDISFEVKENEIIGFLGPNGAGKSTTLKVLTCFHSATGGTVTIDGIDVFTHPEKVKAITGYLPENVPLYPELRVNEYLSYRAELKKIPRSKRSKAIDDAMGLCRLSEVSNRIIGQLSKGYRQRVGLADALLADPKILILDEPTIGLDPNQIRDVRSLIKDLGKKRTVILSSHILPEVEAVCSRIIIINKGKIVGQGKPEELRQNMGKNETAVTLELLDPQSKALGALEGLNEISKVEKGTTKDCYTVFSKETNPVPKNIKEPKGINVREAIFDAAVANDFKIIAMSTSNHSLEDIFVEITTREDIPPKNTESEEVPPENKATQKKNQEDAQ